MDEWCNKANMWCSDMEDEEYEMCDCEGDCKDCEECEEIHPRHAHHSNPPY